MQTKIEDSIDFFMNTFEYITIKFHKSTYHTQLTQKIKIKTKNNWEKK